jgi:hypothetical protein
MTTKITWSYSSLDLFKQCPKKYYHLRVVKDIKESETEHLTYGKQVHEAAELYIGKGTPIPPQFAFIQPHLDLLKKMGGGGEFLCEYKMGLTRNLEPCDFFAPDVWWRGVADLIIIKDDKAYLVDYKTGKSSKYADTKQLEILSLALFKHKPNLQKVKAGLLFLIAKDFVKVDFDSEKQSEPWVKWLNDFGQLEAAYSNEVWNSKPNFSCKNYCPVVTCMHNGKNH